ncbi:MAG: AbrB/MazE/SpoVT family DNA-binding domain-containing protein [Nitrososphaerota archaeon]|nr:AbrB/MazE/SpoVT family DNA-binding domain-containing protein [Nitrososphaerota archaeon]
MTKARVGQKGQVVIPSDIRQKIGMKAGTEVVIDMKDDEVVIKRASPETKSYVDYYMATYSKKLKKHVDIKKIIEEESIGRTGLS